jgi:hypothetical protein
MEIKIKIAMWSEKDTFDSARGVHVSGNTEEFGARVSGLAEVCKPLSTTANDRWRYT